MTQTDEKRAEANMARRIAEYSRVSLETLDLIEKWHGEGIEARIVMVAVLHLAVDGLAAMTQDRDAFDITMKMATDAAVEKHFGDE